MNGSQGTQRHVYSVKEFTLRLKHMFAKHSVLSNIAISGEVSDFRTFGNGHVSFRLKEEQAVVECIAWSDRRRDLVPVENGMTVVAEGSVGIRQERGCYQLVVERLEPIGRGALFLQYQRLKEKFAAEGLFDESRKRAVPKLPRRVALISARGKAMEDFAGTMLRKAPFVEIRFIEAQVQGQGAEIEIAAAIDKAATMEVDAIVLTRGGGSYEDLFPFNLEPVVRAIVRSRHPVLTAIGHSGDHHLADDAADKYFISPSAAAEHIAHGWLLAAHTIEELRRTLLRVARGIVMQAAHRLEEVKRDLHGATERLAIRKRTRLQDLSAQLDRRSPREVVARNRERLLRSRSAIDMRLERFLNETRRSVERMGARLELLSPSAPLARGYAIVMHDGKVVRDVLSLRIGDALEARFERGGVTATVESVRGDA